MAGPQNFQPPDPVFPSIEETDDNLVRELVEGGRSKTQAKRVLEELAAACRASAAELEVLLEVCSDAALMFCGGEI